MLRQEWGITDGYRPPKSRALLEQVALAYRIAVSRSVVPRMTWDELAEEEDIPKRTLQHFYRSWLDGLKEPASAQDSRRVLLERVNQMLAYTSR
jgi:hypothetical protein